MLPTEAVWTDAIELGVSCFLSLRGSDDDAIYDRLDALGVAPWLSSRLVVARRSGTAAITRARRTRSAL